MRIIPNEELRAKELIEKGNNTLSKSLRNDLFILAKYYKQQNKDDNGIIDTNKIKELLREFCKKNIKKYNEVLYFDLIKSAIAYMKKEDLFIYNPVIISRIELEKIKIINNIQQEKVLFTILVLSKLYNQKIEKIINNKNTTDKKREKLKKSQYYFYENMRDLFKDANVSMSVKDRENLIIELYRKELITVSNNKSYKPLIIDEEIDINNKKNIIINDFRELGLQYALLKGDKDIIKCDNCGKPIIPNNNRQKYCLQCWKEKEKELWRENKRKHRENETNVQV